MTKGDAFRKRLDTGCTADSKDSGIDMRSRERAKKPQRRMQRIEEETTRRWDVDTILWVIVFLLTAWFFNLPFSIWFSHRVNWLYLNSSLACNCLFAFSGICIYYRHRAFSNWRTRSPKTFAFAWIAFAIGVVYFTLGTWDLFGYWSIYISVVTLMFLVSLSSLLTN